MSAIRFFPFREEKFKAMRDHDSSGGFLKIGDTLRVPIGQASEINVVNDQSYIEFQPEEELLFIVTAELLEDYRKENANA